VRDDAGLPLVPEFFYVPRNKVSCGGLSWVLEAGHLLPCEQRFLGSVGTQGFLTFFGQLFDGLNFK